ncbi:FabZ [Chryseobacterium sp. Leaf180]|uniref:hypothetical protein n=1 Tax=Chryseobacterium sp. Leaf180 TaxID=1736289 RepID=UPI0006F9661F|nr:hypothetical protein [Chryseobacterium sp. Leaf180]KQR94990.1 FabZ [Chryseobacterium sp. Leaf180]
MEIQLPVSDPDFIGKLIPQKTPFVMVSGIISYSETDLISEFIIPEDHLFVQKGYFQASGLIEHQAQSVALHTGFRHHLLGKETPTGYIGAIKSFEAEELPKAGSRLESEITILNEMLGVTSVEIITRLEGKTIARSEMKTVIK